MFVNIGFGNFVNAERISSMITPDSAPSKRLVQRAKEENRCIDATQGRRTRGIIITAEDQVILSALVPETIASRIQGIAERPVVKRHDQEGV